MSSGSDIARKLPDSPDPRLTKIVEYRLAGKSWGQIANEIDCDPKTLWQLRHDYDLEDLIDQITRDRIEALATGHVEMVSKAREVLVELLASDDERIRLAAALKLYPNADTDELSKRRRSKRVQGLPDDELEQRALAALGRRQGR